jgi:FlaG/FlaF family flagellin (archaellin)
VADLRTDQRAVSPVVGKTLEIGIVLLFVSLVTVALYGGIVPEYRTAAAEEVGDRTLVAAAERIETAVPPDATGVHSETRVDLPRTIRDEQYRLRITNRTLVLDHPDAAVSGRLRLAFPDRVTDVSGVWDSTDDLLVVVDGGANVSVRLEVAG